MLTTTQYRTMIHDIAASHGYTTILHDDSNEFWACRPDTDNCVGVTFDADDVCRARFCDADGETPRGLAHKRGTGADMATALTALLDA